MAATRPRRPGPLPVVAVGALAAALLAGVLSLLLPGFLSRNFDARSLASLRRQAVRTRREFSGRLDALAARRSRFAGAALPAAAADFVTLFRSSGLDPENEGAALTGGDGDVLAWYGNVLSPESQWDPEALREHGRDGGSVLVKSKASVYLVALQPIEGGRMVFHFSRLAFIPPVRSSYIREYNALRPAPPFEMTVDYWDFRDDIAGYEEFFARHGDEFPSQSRQKNEIQTLYFPLRNEVGRITATVTLASPSLTSRLSAAREGLNLAALLALIMAAVAGLAFFWSSPGFLRRHALPPAVLGAGLLAATRLLALPLGRLERLQSLALFKPSVAGFASWAGLTGSPIDIFLTALAGLGLAACAASLAFPRTEGRPGRSSLPLAVLAHLVAAAGAAGTFLALREVCRLVVFNSNLSVLRWDFDLARLALQLGLFAALVAALLVLAVVFRLAFRDRRTAWTGALASGLAAAAAVLASGPRPGLLLAAIGAVLAACVFAVAVRPALARRREVWLAGLVIASLWLARSVDGLDVIRTRRLLETTVAHTVQSQAGWARFLIEESLPVLDRNEARLSAYLKDPKDKETLAQDLWEGTPVARANWYSSLEIRDAEGELYSRFSLNVPKFLGGAPVLPASTTWAIVPHAQTFIGREKDFLVGYRDFTEAGSPIGRVLLYVSLDPEMLPFLYSANPYFEVMRTDSLPALGQIDFGFEIFDLQGRSLFNPGKLTASLAAADLGRLKDAATPFWTVFREGGTVYDAYLFRSGGRVYSLFAPRKNLRTRTVDFLRFFFLGLAAALLTAAVAALARGRASLRRPFWSFSSRVYAAFLAVAVVPLLLFTVFTRNLFDRLFTEQFVEDSAVHATYAQGLMEAFSNIQGTELSPAPSTQEDLAFWISETLSSDVILYQDGVVSASSRREFFESGLLPDIIDGEAYRDLVYGRKPYTVRRTRLGNYSFQTLTVPYASGTSTLFISLPFPFERQQLDRATRETVEFLVVLSAFFVVLVLVFSRGIKGMIIVPVRKLLAGTREVGLGNLEVRIDHRSRDEMMTLIDGFNTMVRNLRTHEQELAEMSKKVAWTEMARKVAHEIKNPLTPIQLSAEHVLKVYEDRRGDFDKALRESMSYIVGEVENLRRIATEFMEIARDTTVRKEPVDLRRVLEEVLDPYRRLLAERIRIALAAEGDDFLARGDAGKLKTAFRNVVANAVEAIGARGEVAVRVGRRGDRFVVTVSDTGAGMSPETAARIFDLYFSTKDAGTGLGLPITKKIIEEHGGAVRVESRPGRGTTVTLELPAGA
ncbi:MAG TPA: ATP-binding protein [Candidatus Aminicenantes bacterium]|nr:ATP-binding protein [Candidatus Aminicenantes bacterium]HRY65992.1 ATP-binding protein [Candidatus Aminicenantes bacterium]HRZ72959.1 ATP-binding protein [Candidatus Aminicenantes bacterium]